MLRLSGFGEFINTICAEYKMRRSAHKKEFCNTIMYRRKVRENSSKKRVS